MNVKEFSARAGISAHTLRYYDRVGVLGRVKRRSNGHRYFNEKDIEWIAFVQRLKDTGMPLMQIQQYAQLREAGESTLQARYELLRVHAEQLEQQLAVQQQHMSKLAQKLRWYDDQLAVLPCVSDSLD